MTLLEKEDRRVVEELRQAGIEVNSIYDLVNSSNAYRSAIPVLLRLLPTIRDDRIKEGVVRALAVKEAVAESAARRLIREFTNISPSASPSKQALKWVIANTLSVIARDEIFAEVVSLIRDRQHGDARQMLAEALANMKDPRAADVLLELLGDDEVAGHAIVALGKLRDPNAAAAIERFCEHPEPWVRKEAKRALSRIRQRRRGS